MKKIHSIKVRHLALITSLTYSGLPAYSAVEERDFRTLGQGADEAPSPEISVDRDAITESSEDGELLVSTATGAAHFKVVLYEDVRGVRGNEMSSDQLKINQSFFVEVAVKENDNFRVGIRTASADVLFDPRVLEVLPSDFKLEKVIPTLPVLRLAKYSNTAGVVRLKGSMIISSGTGPAIGSGKFDTFAVFRMRARGLVGATNIDVTFAPGEKVILSPTMALDPVTSIVYSGKTIQVYNAAISSPLPAIQVKNRPPLIYDYIGPNFGRTDANVVYKLKVGKVGVGSNHRKGC